MAEKKEKQYVSDNAQLMAEWDWEKNKAIDPSNLMLGSGKKVWWKCKEGHSWEEKPNNRTSGNKYGCPYCSNHRVLSGFNDLSTTHPNLALEWHPTKNGNLAPNQITYGSSKKVWWKCSNGHEWQAAIHSRHSGHGCPYCAGRIAIKGQNDLLTINPILAKEWDWDKNTDVDPYAISWKSDIKAWWRCSVCGHSWETAVKNRSNGSSCPKCAKATRLQTFNKKLVHRQSSLAEKNPDLARQWLFSKNGKLTPHDVTSNSGKKVWWKCSQGHEWQATITDRNNGTKCPYCAGLYVVAEENDLQTVNPALASEWNFNRNIGLLPTHVSANSNKKVWWQCRKGHEWQAIISNRSKGSGCPICNSEHRTSFPEYALVFYLEQYGLDPIHSYRGHGFELDVYIPSKNLAIEYDGYLWHKNKIANDIEKNQKCIRNGIKLYRIREGLLPLNDSSIDYIVQRNQKDLSIILGEVLREIIGVPINVDLERDSVAIDNLREYTEKHKSLLFSNPGLAEEWNYEKNINLKPEYFTANSGKKVWWKCSNGHEWVATIASRNSGNGCPYCSGRYVAKGENDLQTGNPALAKEWHYERNGELKPTQFTVNSGKSVWWICGKGHEWQARIAHRNNGSGCPYCSGRYAITGENDLQTINPSLASEWHYAKNAEFTPSTVLPNSNKKVWWKCSKGHEWIARISSRNKGNGCPQCAMEKHKVND